MDFFTICHGPPSTIDNTVFETDISIQYYGPLIAFLIGILHKQLIAFCFIILKLLSC